MSYDRAPDFATDAYYDVGENEDFVAGRLWLWFRNRMDDAMVQIQSRGQDWSEDLADDLRAAQEILEAHRLVSDGKRPWEE